MTFLIINIFHRGTYTVRFSRQHISQRGCIHFRHQHITGGRMHVLYIHIFNRGTYDFFSHQRISQRGVCLFLVINIFHKGTYAFLSHPRISQRDVCFFSHRHISQRDVYLF